MRLKEQYTYTYDDKTGLTILERGVEVVRQPHHSDHGGKFDDETDALAWAIAQFPDFFTP